MCIRDSATAIGGAHNARDFNRIEAKARGGGYRNLQAFGDDVAKCFANARAWKARVEFLHRGSPEAWCSQKPIAGAIVEGSLRVSYGGGVRSFDVFETLCGEVLAVGLLALAPRGGQELALAFTSC